MNREVMIVERREFEHAGLRCFVVGLAMGHRCGYVAVPEGHPWHGLGCDEPIPSPRTAPPIGEPVDDYGMAAILPALFGKLDDPATLERLDLNVRVHGGVTWTGPIEELAGEAWLIGFDCGHAFDLRDEALISEEFEVMRRLNQDKRPDATLWTADKVAAEVRRLADQVAARAPSTTPRTKGVEQ